MGSGMWWGGRKRVPILSKANESRVQNEIADFGIVLSFWWHKSHNGSRPAGSECSQTYLKLVQGCLLVIMTHYPRKTENHRELLPMAFAKICDNQILSKTPIR